MILVVGATGLLGTRVCERLRAEGQPVRELVRRTSDPDKVNALRSFGCELATGDLKEPPQIGAACKGITAVISTASSTLSRQQGDSIESVDLHGQLTLVNAAKAAGGRRFIYASFRDHPTIQYPLTEAKRSVEHAIADLDFTSIQASWFMEVWLSPALGFDYVHGKVRLYGSGSKPISWVSYRDVAEDWSIFTPPHTTDTPRDEELPENSEENEVTDVRYGINTATPGLPCCSRIPCGRDP